MKPKHLYFVEQQVAVLSYEYIMEAMVLASSPRVAKTAVLNMCREWCLVHDKRLTVHDYGQVTSPDPLPIPVWADKDAAILALRTGPV